MAELTASCWTIDMLPTNASASIIHPDVHGFITSKVRTTRVRATLNNGASGLTYPAGGIPLPTFAATTPAGEPSYGMRRNLSYLIPIGEQMASVSRAEDVLWKYVPSGGGAGGAGAMRAFHDVSTATHFVEVPTTWSATLLTDKEPSFEFEAKGW